MRLSVVVPCYNAGRFVSEAIASVRAQTVQVDEIIAVDDGSSDDTAHVLHRLAPHRVLQQQNGGAASARNAGVRAATGDVVAFLDADDILPADSIAARLSMLSPGIDAVGGVVEHFQESVPGGAAAVRAPMQARMPGAVLFRRSLFDSVGLFDPSIRMGEAMDWFARFEAAGRTFAWTNSVVLLRRVHDANTTRDVATLRADYLAVLRRAVAVRRGAEPA